MSEMLRQVAEAKESAKHTAATGEGGNPNGQADELPEGSSPVEASEASSKDEAEVTEEASKEIEGDAVAAAPAEPETLITINGREFKTQSEAIKYAEELERKAEAAELYNQGVRDALSAGKPIEAQAQPEDDNFEERFYANPKEMLKEVQQKATQDALRQIQAEQKKEALWTEFLSSNPDIRRKDAERVLQENWDTIGAMTDVSRAMKVLAQKTRAEYQDIIDHHKPRTELAAKKGQVVSPAGGSAPRVTPQKKEEAPLDFASQLRKLKGH